MGYATVKDVMTHLVVALRPEDSVHEAATTLARNRISGAPVVREGMVVGVVSEADLIVAVSPPLPIDRRISVLDLVSILGRGKPAKHNPLTTVGEVMTRSVITIGPDESVWKAAAVMDRYGVKRLPVVDRDKSLLGIISRADLVRAMARDDGEIATDVRESLEVLGPDGFEDLQVDCQDGVVTLAGVTDRFSTKEIALRLTSRVPGVTGIKDRLDYVSDDRKIEVPAQHYDPWAEGRLAERIR